MVVASVKRVVRVCVKRVVRYVYEIVVEIKKKYDYDEWKAEMAEFRRQGAISLAESKKPQ